MKVLVADTGTEPDDHTATIPGELVVDSITCDRDRLRTGDACGCGKLWTGLASRRYTTVARVVDRPDLDVDTFAGLLADSLASSGWKNVVEWAQEWAEDVADLAAEWPEDTRLRRDVDEVGPA